MHDAKLGTILENAARLAGRDPSTVAIPEGWKVLAGMALAEGLNTLAAEKFPLMQRVEFRRYRPPFVAGTAYRLDQEVWYDGAYWRRVGEGAGAPSVETGWRRLQPGEVAAFIAFDQPWEQVVMQSFGVDTARFAYTADPRYNPDATPVKGCRLCELGVLLPAPAPEDDTTGLWRPLRVRGEFAAYLTRLIASDLLTEDQGKYQTKAAADAELERLIERYHEGNGETRVRTGRFR